jgi:hypothetical protein
MAHQAGDWSGGLRVQGGAVRASLHHEAKRDAIKGPVRKRGGCAMKVRPTHVCGCEALDFELNRSSKLASWEGLAKQLTKRDDEGMDGQNNEREFYRRIISRASAFRERAAESLRQSRVLRKGRGDAGCQPDAPPKQRGLRRRN